jgi:hypothetical protein
MMRQLAWGRARLQAARSTEFIQKHETADQNAQRNPEVKVGRDGVQ